jgi:hypothetical protein
LSNYSGSGTAPGISDYTSIGVVGVKSDRLAVINQLIGSLPSNSTDTSTEIQAVVDAYAAVVLAASSGRATVITLQQLQNLGLSGINSSNFAAVANAISAAGAAGVDSLLELQNLVTEAISSITSSVNVITAFLASPTSSPSLTAYKSAGLIGVTSANKAQIESALLEANPAPTSPAEIQAVINSVIAAPLVMLSNANTQINQIRIADFAQAGIEGVSASNLNSILAVLALKESAALDTVAEVQRLVDEAVMVIAVIVPTLCRQCLAEARHAA